MKPSRYNLLLPDTETGGLLLFNTLYGSLSRWEPREVANLEGTLASPSLSDGNRDLLATLESLQYLVPDELDELEIVRSRKRAGVRDANRLDVTIMPTLDCNFACTYCYEVRRESRMKPATVRSICRWLEREIPGRKLLFLIWYGGEPLLQRLPVLEITRHARRLAESHGVATIFNVTTNGYCLTPARSRELVDLGILDYQVTIDGPRESHDRLRVLRSGRGTFDRVFSHLVSLARTDPAVSITLRINFNQTNLLAIPRLLTEVPEDIRPQLRLSLEPVFGEQSQSATANLESKIISDAVASAYQEAAGLGFDVVNGVSAIQAGKLVYCGAERESQTVINYNGDVFKCGVSRFDTSERVGFIDRDGTLVKDERAWGEYVSPDLFATVCEKCVHLPLCMGGCRAARLRAGNTGSFCALVPTNTAYVLQQIAYGGLPVIASQACADHEQAQARAR